MTGNNFGTPGAVNLSPVVMNEIMFNPSGEYKEWAELYNISSEDIDVAGWYFENSEGDKVVISEENGDNDKNLGDDGETIVPSGGMLVVYFDEEYFNNEKDEIWLYNDMGTPDDEDDDVREDAYEYEDADVFPEDKTFSRMPDGVGIWIDPEATPGGENKLADKELEGFRLLAYEKCFDGEKMKKDNKEQICAPAFLQYLGMIKDLDDKKIKDSTLIDILEMKKEEEKKKLAELLLETEQMLGNQDISSGGESTAGVSEPAEENPAGEAGVTEPEISDTEAEENNLTGEDLGLPEEGEGEDDPGTIEERKESEPEVKPETKEEEPANMITNETNGQI